MRSRGMSLPCSATLRRCRSGPPASAAARRRSTSSRSCTSAAPASCAARSANAQLRRFRDAAAVPDAGAVQLARQLMAEVLLPAARLLSSARRCRRRRWRRPTSAPAARLHCRHCRWNAARTDSRPRRRPTRRSGAPPPRNAATTLATPRPRVSCTCSEMRSRGITPATSSHSSATLRGVATPMVSAMPTSSTPAATAAALSSTTRRGSTRPS